MKRICMDTNAWTALCRGNTQLARILDQAQAVLVPVVVLGELLDGFKGGTREQENRTILDSFSDKPRTMVLPLSEETADWYALVKQQLRRKGNPIPTNDIWIAALCMEHGARLLTFDTHFRNIDGLQLCPVT